MRRPWPPPGDVAATAATTTTTIPPPPPALLLPPPPPTPRGVGARRRKGRAVVVPGDGITTAGSGGYCCSCRLLPFLVVVLLAIQLAVLVLAVVGSSVGRDVIRSAVMMPPSAKMAPGSSTRSVWLGRSRDEQPSSASTAQRSFKKDAGRSPRELHEQQQSHQQVGLPRGGGVVRGGAAGMGGAPSILVRTNDEAYDDKRGGGAANIHNSNYNSSTMTMTTVSVAAAFAAPLEYAAGTLHVRVVVGQPSQPQLWIVDTGSHLSATACAPFLSQSALLPYYDPRASTTHKVVPCGSCQLSRSPLNSEASSSCGQRRRRRLDPAKDPDDDDDGSIKKCRVTQRYTEGSQWTAYEANDLVMLSAMNNSPVDEPSSSSIRLSSSATTPSVSFTFGCQTSCTGQFRHQIANGILGLERSSNSYVSHLYRHQLVRNNAFSICTSPRPGRSTHNNLSSPNDLDGGRLGLGGALLDQHVSPMQFTSIVNPESHGLYRVQVVEVWLGSQLLANNHSSSSYTTSSRLMTTAAFNRGKGTVIDSGTTDTFLPLEMATAWQESWIQQTGRSWHKRTDTYTFESFRELPSVTLHVAGLPPQGTTVRWIIPPEHYMEAGSVPTGSLRGSAGDAASSAYGEKWSGTRQFTNRIYVDEKDGAVLGLNAMRGYDILFDVENRRVGLAPVRSCG